MVPSHFPLKWSMLWPTALAPALLWLGCSDCKRKRHLQNKLCSFCIAYCIIRGQRRQTFSCEFLCFVSSPTTINACYHLSHPTEMKQYDRHKYHILTDGTTLCLPTTQSMFGKFLALQGSCWGKWALRPLFNVWVHGLAALTTSSLCLARRDFRFNELMSKLSCSAQKVIAKEEKEKMERERD